MTIDPSRFFRVYANLMLAERKQVCCVVDDEPISWDVARKEIEGKTPMSDKILEALVRLELI